MIEALLEFLKELFYQPLHLVLVMLGFILLVLSATVAARLGGSRAERQQPEGAKHGAKSASPSLNWLQGLFAILGAVSFLTGIVWPVLELTGVIPTEPTPTPVAVVPSPTYTPIPPTSTSIPTFTPTPTDIPTFTPTPTDIPTSTPTPTDIPTFTPTPTDIPTFTPTPTDIPTFTPTPTDIPTFTPTPTITPTLASPQASLKVAGARVRAGPLLECSILHTGQVSETFEVKSWTRDEAGSMWYQVCCLGDPQRKATGWSHETVLDFVGSLDRVPAVENPGCPLFVDDFDKCRGSDYERVHSLDAAPDTQDSILVAYQPEPDGGCAAKLSYQVSDWVNFSIALKDAAPKVDDWSRHTTLVFDARADPDLTQPLQLKVEPKRADGTQIKVWHVTELTGDWRKVSIPLTGFRTLDDWDGWTQMVELVLTIEWDHPQDRSGQALEGVLYLDNVMIE